MVLVTKALFGYLEYLLFLLEFWGKKLKSSGKLLLWFAGSGGARDFVTAALVSALHIQTCTNPVDGCELCMEQLTAVSSFLVFKVYVRKETVPACHFLLLGCRITFSPPSLTEQLHFCL